jgi:manganese/zinc/iron transport system permease protein
MRVDTSLRKPLGVSLVAVVFLTVPATAAATESHFAWPAWSELLRLLTLQDYNTRVVILGTTLLGFAAGLAGTFLILRKRALLSDALSHATLPGIALAFILMSMVLGQGKYLLGLIAGAAIFSVMGTVSVLLIQRYSRLKDDAALGIVLSVYFGLGIALMGFATRMQSGGAAGLSSFIYGKTASMLFFDATLIGITALLAALGCLALFKEFALICFDADYAATQGWPVAKLDLIMMALVVVVTVIGLQAVGLILVVALLIIPPSAARFWTHNLKSMLWISGLIGALSGFFGAAISALMANLPAGAVIVLTASTLFIISLLLGTQRGLLRTSAARRHLRRKIMRENLLRELYEWFETRCTESQSVATAFEQIDGPEFEQLLARRSWPRRQLQRTLDGLHRENVICQSPHRGIVFTAAGVALAGEVVRKHRLWEAYLITYADIAPGHVDWGADQIEHVLDKRLIDELERRLPELGAKAPPESPHRLRAAHQGVTSS